MLKPTGNQLRRRRVEKQRSGNSSTDPKTIRKQKNKSRSQSSLKYAALKAAMESEMVAAQPNSNQQMRNELFGEGKLVKT
jgi:hypothetical protein